MTATTKSPAIPAAFPHEKPSEFTVCLVSPVSAQANGGTAAYIRFLGNHLAERGHQVQGLCRVHTDVRATLRYEYAETTTPEGSPVIAFAGWETRFIQPRPYPTFVLRHLVRLLTRPALRGLGIRLHRTAYDTALDAAILPHANIVHYTGPGWELLGFSALAAARKRQAAFTVMPFVHPQHWGDSPVDIAFYNAADAVFVCTERERTHLLRCGVHPERLQKTGMAPASLELGDGQRFRDRHRLGNRPLLFFLGRKQRYKGYHAVRESLSRVVRIFPDACFVAAGPEGELPYPEVPPGNFLDLGELRPTDPAHRQEKADALAACDIYCMPSTGEAFGIVYAEAWAYGVPVIGGMAPALEELIEDDINGYRVEQNPEAIAQTVIRLLKDPQLRQRLGQAGQQRQRERFTWEAVVRTHEAVFAEALRRQI